MITISPMIPTSRAGLLALVLPLLPGGDDEFALGVRAYREGRPQDAARYLRLAAQAAGDAASPELLFDLALASLASGELRQAEIAAEKAAVRGGGTFVPLRDFVLGSAAFARCARAEAQASGPEAEPFAFDIAIGYAIAAQSAWQRAAASRDDWPEARRNVERAQAKLAELRDKKREAQKRKEQAKREQKPKRSEQKPEGDGKGKEEEVQARPQPPDAGDPQLQALLDLLAAKEKEKRELRRMQQVLQAKPARKGW